VLLRSHHPLISAHRPPTQVFDARKTPVPNYYASWKKWLPIMRAYEERRASYFATPAVQLVQVRARGC
jgi:alanine-glyoxylate transaminase / serine-glyoxylate transaminase / serine-pyruvate transaminase